MNAIPQVNSALAAHAAGKLRADERLANARAFAARALGAGAILAGTGAALGLAFWGYAQIGAPVAPFAFTTHFLMTTQCSFGGDARPASKAPLVTNFTKFNAVRFGDKEVVTGAQFADGDQQRPSEHQRYIKLSRPILP